MTVNSTAHSQVLLPDLLFDLAEPCLHTLQLPSCICRLALCVLLVLQQQAGQLRRVGSFRSTTCRCQHVRLTATAGDIPGDAADALQSANAAQDVRLQLPGTDEGSPVMAEEALQHLGWQVEKVLPGEGELLGVMHIRAGHCLQQVLQCHSSSHFLWHTCRKVGEQVHILHIAACLQSMLPKV
jgi:hypothetical protein